MLVFYIIIIFSCWCCCCSFCTSLWFVLYSAAVTLVSVRSCGKQKIGTLSRCMLVWLSALSSRGRERERERERYEKRNHFHWRCLVWWLVGWFSCWFNLNHLFSQLLLLRSSIHTATQTELNSVTETKYERLHNNIQRFRRIIGKELATK